MKFTFAPEATPLPGFRIKRAIDRGGFGEVYYAVTDSGKEVALKLLQRNEQVELRGVTQCLNLKHPNLVPIYDIRTDAEGNHWVVMEYVAGKSLERVLEDHPKGLPMSEVETWLQGIAQGISFLHDRGIVHRDLKPANIFREGGQVKIGDVGLCKLITPSRRSAQTESVGTVYYMAPEVAKGRYLSELDIYSLGIIVYEMITGRVPFDGESTGEILMKHLTERPDLSRLPAAVRESVGRALEKDPQRRTPTAIAFAQEFSAALRQPRSPGPAMEIPASHFVDVERLERDYASKPAPSPRASRGANSPNSDVSGQNRAADGFTWAGFGQELKNNPLLLLAVIVSAMTVVPVLGMSVGRVGGNFHRVFPGFVIWGAIGYVIYWLVSGKCRQSKKLVLRSPEPPRPIQPSPPRGAPVAVRVVNPPPPPRPAPTPPPPRQTPVANRRPTPKPRPIVYSPDTLRTISVREKTGDVTAAMAAAAVWSLVVTAVVGAFGHWVADVPGSSQIFDDPARIGLFALTTVAASWMVLVPAKFWEGREVDGWGRRFVMLALGAAVGATAWWLNESLLVELRPEWGDRSALSHVGHYSLSNPDGTLSLTAYCTFFAVLLGLPRWWLQADGFRKHRVTVWSLMVPTGLAWVVPAFLCFNQTWGVCWAVAISAVVQLSARWISTAERPAWVAARGIVTSDPTA